MKKDLNSFLRQLKFARWSKWLGFVFAFIAASILAIYFFIYQVNHDRKEWNIQHLSFIPTETITLKAGRIYKISWDDSTAVPTEVILDEMIGHPHNVYQYRNYIKPDLDYDVNVTCTNPMYIRLDQEHDFGMSFDVITIINFNLSFGEFVGQLFKYMTDGTDAVELKIEDVTDTYGYQRLSVDGSFHFFRRL